MNRPNQMLFLISFLLGLSPSALALEPMLGEIRLFGGNFAPRGWSDCDGRLLPINQNQALFSLLGTTYGGDGRTTFGLPDLRGRFAVHPGTSPRNSNAGFKFGKESLTLFSQNFPPHTHAASVNTPVKIRATSTSADTDTPGGNFLAKTQEDRYRSGPAPLVDLKKEALKMNVSPPSNSTNPVSIRSPYLGMRFIIATQGVFPSR